MSESTTIEWCDHTINFWHGCTKVSPGCANCYAEGLSRRFGKDIWGPGKAREDHRAGAIKLARKLNRQAARVLNAVAMCHGCGYLSDDPRSLSGCKGYCQDSTGKRCNALPCPKCGKVHYWCGSFRKPHRPRVFCNSMSDWLDPEVPIDWLADMLDVIRTTPHLDWLLLTKRPGWWYSRIKQVADFYSNRGAHDACNWICTWRYIRSSPENVWIGTSVEDQRRADERIPELLKIPARVRFLSCEPLLGPVDLSGERLVNLATPFAHPGMHQKPLIDWVIAGGESGSQARPMHPDWARSLRDQCAAAGVPFFFKQWGEFAPMSDDALKAWVAQHGRAVTGFSGYGETLWRVGKKSAGRLLDGREHNEFPKTGG